MKARHSFSSILEDGHVWILLGLLVLSTVMFMEDVIAIQSWYVVPLVLPVFIMLAAMWISYRRRARKAAIHAAALFEARQQIDRLVEEIERLCHAAIPPHVYFPGFLRRIVAALAAYDATIWLMDDKSQFRLVYVSDFDSPLWDELEHHVQHEMLLQRVVTSGRGEWVDPLSEGQDRANPTEQLLLAQPLRAHGRMRGVLEVFQRPTARAETRNGYMRFLAHVARLAGE